MPNLAGMCDWRAYQFTRAAGLRLSNVNATQTIPIDACGAGGGRTVAGQDQSPGAKYSPGSIVSGRLYQYA
jgi:hypothetical protein